MEITKITNLVQARNYKPNLCKKELAINFSFIYLGNKNNPAVLTIQNKNDILLTNFPGHNPKIRFDGSGGIMMNKVNRVEIRGFEIVGPNNGITKSEAMEVFRNTYILSLINLSPFAKGVDIKMLIDAYLCLLMHSDILISRSLSIFIVSTKHFYPYKNA